MVAGPVLAQAAGARPSTPFGRGGSEVHYDIDARLDGETKRLDGREVIRWTNKSGQAAEDLWFHLYLNAYSNNHSTHLTESGGKLRGVKIEEGWAWIRVLAIGLVDEQGTVVADLFPTFQYRRPDDGNEDDRTVFSVDLPQPVADGETVSIAVQWESQLPRVRRRTGYKDDFLLVAHWFPKLGVLESGRGWNAHQFHMSSEFYSDYGTYDVTLDLPARYREKVFGSGVKVNSRQKDDRVEVNFVAPSRPDQRRADAWGRLPVVHDFTWTGDPDYVEKSYRFSFDDWAARYPDEVAAAREAFGPDEPIELRDVLVTVLIQPERVDQAERHRKATEAALFFYGLWFGEYPYEHVTVIDPAWGARAAGGMEYPTLFTCGTALNTTEDMHRPEGVTVHECGHQFWYGLVGNNEFEAAWLDEGFNSFTDAEVMARVYGPQRSTTEYLGFYAHGVPRIRKLGTGKLHRALTGREIPLPFVENLTPLPEFGGDSDNSLGFLDWWRDQPRLTFSPQYSDPRWKDRTGYLRNPSIDVMDTPAWRYVDRPSYSTNSYPRPAVALRTLRGLVGDAPFMRGMRGYAKEWRYRHPYPEDFFASFQASSGVEEDLSWYFEELFQGNGTVDWSVSVDQRRRPSPAGYFQSGHGEFHEVEMPDEERGDDEDDSEADDDTRAWLVDVVLRREGTLRLPLEVRMVFEDGEERRLLWTREEQGNRSWRREKFESTSKLVSVELDPDNDYWIDTDLSNNRWYDEKDEVAPLRWSERVFSRMTHLLHWYAGLGG